MVAHGGLADQEPLGDLLVPESRADEGDDLALAGGERDDLGLLGSHLFGSSAAGQGVERGRGQRRVEPHLARTDFLDRLEQRFDTLLLRHYPFRAETHGAPVLFAVEDASQNEYLGGPGHGEQVREQVQATPVTGIKGEQDNVRLLPGCKAQGLRAVRCLTDDVQPRLVFHQPLQGGAHERMIVDNQNAQERWARGSHECDSGSRGRVASPRLGSTARTIPPLCFSGMTRR